MPTIRLPRLFFDDHLSRGCPTPETTRETARFVWVDGDDLALGDLYNDAEYYENAGSEGWDDGLGYLGAAARRLLVVLRKAGWDSKRARKAMRQLDALDADAIVVSAKDGA